MCVRPCLLDTAASQQLQGSPSKAFSLRHSYVQRAVVYCDSTTLAFDVISVYRGTMTIKQHMGNYLQALSTQLDNK